MTETASAAAPNPGLFARMIGVLLSPRETFAAIAARPRWLGVMAITLVVAAACQYVILSSPAMQDAMFEQATRNPNMTDAQLAGAERVIERLPIFLPIGTVLFGAAFTAAIAGILMLIFSTLMGGSAQFKQVYSVVAHSGVVSTLQGIVTAGLIMLGAEPSGTSAPGANLAVFVPMLEETSFVTRFLGAIDLILVWWIFTLAIGLGVLYKRSTGGIATTLLIIYVVIALIVGYVRSGS